MRTDAGKTYERIKELWSRKRVETESFQRTDRYAGKKDVRTHPVRRSPIQTIIWMRDRNVQRQESERQRGQDGRFLTDLRKRKDGQED